MDTVFLIFEILGTVAFSVSGALTGIKKNMDVLGVIILGYITSVGGGVIRDLVLGITPPTTFVNPTYAVIAILTAIVVFLPCTINYLNKHSHRFDFALLIMDTVGLGVFTVVGIQTAYRVNQSSSFLLLLFVGVITGVGGGILRDVLASNPPYIFVKHFYASASIIGAVACILLRRITNNYVASDVCGAVIVVTLRFLAAHFRWKLPKHNKDDVKF